MKVSRLAIGAAVPSAIGWRSIQATRPREKAPTRAMSRDGTKKYQGESGVAPGFRPTHGHAKKAATAPQEHMP